MKISQISENPFKYSDTNKRYHTYDYYLKHRFGEKCAKIPLDAGLCCPNIDGTISYGGCIYCQSGSGARLASNTLPLLEQYKQGILLLGEKWKTKSYIPYLQAYTNTHTSPDNLSKILDQVSHFDGAVMLDIATRADCLEDEKLEIINEVSKRIPITLELGLQSSNDKTAKLINRGHSFDVFCDCVERIRKIAPSVKIGVHIINGLPGESMADMENTARSVAFLRPDLVKIHLLHILKATSLASLFEAGKYTPLTKEEYVNSVCNQIELLPPETVIERVTGDGLPNELIAPLWSLKKVSVINDIDKELVKRNSYQGKYFNS